MYTVDHADSVTSEVLKYQITAQYADIITTSADPMRYKRLAKMIRQLAALEHCSTAEILTELRDDSTEYN